MPVKQDTAEVALQGKLGQSEGAVQDAFHRLDRLVSAILATVDRRAITRAGEWMGRSYLLGRRLVLRIDPKIAFLRVWVGGDAYAGAPSLLVGQYRQDGWLIVRPTDLDHALAYLEVVLNKSEAEIRTRSSSRGLGELRPTHP